MKKKVKATKKELFYDNFSREWESRINNVETNKRLNVVFKKLFKTSDLKGKRFLEVGCGIGYFSNRATDIGAYVTGIDVGPKLIEICKSKNKSAHFRVGSASDIPFKNNIFEVLLSTEVIEHVDDQSKAINEMIRVVKPGGLLVITTPNKLFKPLFDLLSKIGLRPYKGNEKWFYPWSLRRILVKKGLVVQKEYFFNLIYPTPILDRFENVPILKYFCINYGLRLKKV